MSVARHRRALAIALALALAAGCGETAHYTLRDRQVPVAPEDEEPRSSADEPSATPAPSAPGASRVEEPSPIRVTVHTTSGPLSPSLARRALAPHRAAIERCFREVLGPSASGSIRASIFVDASGVARADLETMEPTLDRVLPCVAAALERVAFPATAEGRPTHVVAMIARTPS